MRYAGVTSRKYIINIIKSSGVIIQYVQRKGADCSVLCLWLLLWLSKFGAAECKEFLLFCLQFFWG